MDNFSKSPDQQLDNQLSEFTDQVLSSNENEAKVQEVINQDELAQLQKTVLRMKAAVQAARMSGATNACIRARLLEEWKKTRQAERTIQKRLVWNWSLSRIALTGGFVILIIFSLTAIFIPSATSLIGTAHGSQAWSPLFIFAGIVIIVLLLWHNRQK